MKKYIISIIGLVFFALIFMGNTDNADNPLIGSWNFNVNQAPWEYSRGKIIFEKDKDDITVGKIIFSSGTELTIPRIILKDKLLTFEVIVDGYTTKTTATLEDDNLSGYVETSEGNLPFCARKEVP